jgi:hypothetical protein
MLDLFLERLIVSIARIRLQVLQNAGTGTSHFFDNCDDAIMFQELQLVARMDVKPIAHLFGNGDLSL